jgi:hypothetical protein
MDATRTVGSFVEVAFPQGTIPCHSDPDLDFSYNHKNYVWATGKVDPEEARGCLKQFPPWPADLFAVTGALLETTSAYQQLANAIYPRDRPRCTEQMEDAASQLDAEWAKAIDPCSKPDTASPFGVHGRDRIVLRVIGTLWGHGALILSGVHIGKKKISDPETILARNVERISNQSPVNVISFFVERLRSEIDRSDVECILGQAYLYVSKLLQFSHLSLENIGQLDLSKHELASNSISLAALNKIVKLAIDHNQTDAMKAKSQIERDASYICAPKDHDDIFETLKYYCLIVWACRYIQYHWSILINCKRPLLLEYKISEGDDEDKGWWRAAVRLLIIADEAGKGLGFSIRMGDPHHRGRIVPPKSSAQADRGADELETRKPQAGHMCRSIWERYLKNLDAKKTKGSNGRISSGLIFPRTLTRCFDENLGAVLPKARTAQNGCTLRSLSLNFGYLPPKGRVRARWARNSHVIDTACYNILLVPYPYQIKSKYVDTATLLDGPDDWGYFKIDPHWLYSDGVDPSKFLDEVHWNRLKSAMPAGNQSRGADYCRSDEERADDESSREIYHKLFWEFLTSLIDDQPVGTIDAVVFPEASLDWYTFDYIQKAILDKHSEIKMLVCGLTSRRDYDANKSEPPTKGNFVATYIRNTVKDPAERHPTDQPRDTENVWEIAHVRSKHHRWKLDAQQLLTYAFSHRLSPDLMWWEDIYLHPREMLFAEFASGSILTTLICEDLARIEPCQIALRSVGPNLVLVLLMDSAQVIGRWPHQYAGVLTDDPGSSILTLTSFGLVRRSNFSEGLSSREIALWREPLSGRARPVPLPPGYHAQLISLRREFGFERTLDGRGDNGDSAAIWRFAGLTPIRSMIAPPGGGPDD